METPIGTIVISDETKDLYRIHLYNNCIKFDLGFAEAIAKHDDICKKMVDISEAWARKKIKHEDVLKKVVFLIEGNVDKFKDFYFKDYELDQEGKYVDLIPIDSLYMDLEKGLDLLYQYLLKAGVLVEISKKEFESNIKQDEYKELYVEFYSDIHSNTDLRYYQYRLNDNFSNKNCAIIANDTKVLFGYVF